MKIPDSQLRSEREAIQQRFECDHSESRLTRRQVGRGGVQHVMQCTRCGKAVSNPISGAAARQMSAGAPIPAFDTDLMNRWERDHTQAYEQADRRYAQRQAGRQTDFWKWYKAYLQSPEWAARRRKVMARAGGVCEGCGDHRAVHVHHTTYQHVGQEFLFELLALCEACHDRIHAEDEQPNGGTW